MFSIRSKILAIVLAFFAFNAAAFILYSLITTRNYEYLRLEGVEKTVAFETERVNKEIAKMERGAIDLAADGLLHFTSGDDHYAEDLLLEYLRGFPGAKGAGIWLEPYAAGTERRREGIYAYYDPVLDDVLLDTIEDDYDYHRLSWYREIAGSVVSPYNAVWTKPYVDDTSFSLMTTAGAGIFDHNRNMIGISIIDWEIRQIIDELSSVRPTENSFVLLCSPSHDYIISSTYTKNAAGASLVSLPWDINDSSFSLGDIKYLQFSRNMDNGWLLSIQIPENEIFAEVETQNRRFTLHIVGSAIFLLGLAYYLISRLINAPIKRLANEVSQLALGNLDVSVTIASKDELGMLAQTFNKMTSDLRRSIEDNTRISTELSVATEMQASMLPCVFPPFPDRDEFDLYASMLPAREVGGDFYDFFLIDEDTLGLVIADVSGKGVPAALFMVVAKTLIKNSACSGKSPREVFEIVNSMLCDNNESNMFVTAFMGYYTISTGRLVYVNAGHNPPLVKSPDGKYGFVRVKPNIVLAWMHDSVYKEEEIYLYPGSTLYLYTDGVTEAMNVELKMFSETRLLETLNKNRKSTPEVLLNAVKNEVDAFADGAEQADDITMLALSINRTSVKSGGGEKMIELEAEAYNLDKLHDFINDEILTLNVPQNILYDIDLAAEEIFTNIANYAYHPGKGSVSVFLNTGNKELLTIRFEDYGKEHNPLIQKDPDLNIPLEERKIGGLGVYLVKKLMNEIEYERIGEKNVLSLVKYLY